MSPGQEAFNKIQDRVLQEGADIEAGKLFTIELDCPPGAPRPDVYLPEVLAGTGLTVADFEEPSKVFGNWKYRLKTEKNDVYKGIQETIKFRIKELYSRGCIRYGSW